MRVTGEVLERLKRQFKRRKPILIHKLNNHRCILCGAEANSYHHLIPLSYSAAYLEGVNSSCNLVPCCLGPERWCHFRLNGVSYCFLSVNRNLYGKLPLRVLAGLIRQWIELYRDELRKKRAAELKPYMKVKKLILCGNEILARFERR